MRLHIDRIFQFVGKETDIFNLKDISDPVFFMRGQSSRSRSSGRKQPPDFPVTNFDYLPLQCFPPYTFRINKFIEILYQGSKNFTFLHFFYFSLKQLVDRKQIGKSGNHAITGIDIGKRQTGFQSLISFVDYFRIHRHRFFINR